MRPEERPGVFDRADALEGDLSLKRQKEGTGKAAVEVGHGDEHEIAPGPDVEGMLVELVGAVGVGTDGELLVAHFDEFLGIVEAAASLHLVPYPRKSPVATKDMVKLISLPGALLAFSRIEAGRWQINIPDLFLKTEPGPGRLSQVNHAAVEHPPGNRPDRLPLLPVLLVVHGLAHHVHGPLVKGDPDLADLVFDPDLAQGLPAPVAHGQVDGTA